MAMFVIKDGHSKDKLWEHGNGDGMRSPPEVPLLHPGRQSSSLLACMLSGPKNKNGHQKDIMCLRCGDDTEIGLHPQNIDTIVQGSIVNTIGKTYMIT